MSFDFDFIGPIVQMKAVTLCLDKHQGTEKPQRF